MDEVLERLLQAQDYDELTIDEVLERYIPKAERDKIADEDFAGKDRAYPCDTQEHLDACARLLGKAPKDEQASIKAKAIKIAKRKGLKLPDSWVEEGETRAMPEPEITSAQMYMPITRIDKDAWVIEGTATNDSIDHYGTIFDYESSKNAFSKWRGNIREMHDSKKAVGRAVEVIPDDENHRIVLRARISKGAKDTWEKICDGTLNGFSIGVPQGKYKTKMIERNGKSVPMFYDHELAEVSVVDNVGTPGCDDVVIARADGLLTDVLDLTEEVETPEATTEETRVLEAEETRSGQRISHATQSDLHDLRNSHLVNAKKTMKICGCDECMQGHSALDPDDDGDIDIMSSTDYDQDGGKKDMMAGYRDLEPVIMRAMQPTIQRYNALAAQIAQNNHQPQTINHTIDTSAIERRLEAMESLAPDMAIVRSLLSEVKELAAQNKALAEQIASQPQQGGPIANGAAMEKLLATQGVPTNRSQMSDADVVRRASEMGLLKDQNSQLAGASKLIEQIMAGRQ